MSLSKEVARLIEYHNSKTSVSYTNCNGCGICEQIQTIRKQKDVDPAEEYKHILAKGKELTFNEIVFLYEKEVPMVIIRKAAGIQHKDLQEFLDFAGVAPIPTMHEVREPKAREYKFNLTKQEYDHLLAKGNTKTQIAQTAGVALCTLYYHVKKWQKAEG